MSLLTNRNVATDPLSFDLTCMRSDDLLLVLSKEALRFLQIEEWPCHTAHAALRQHAEVNVLLL